VIESIEDCLLPPGPMFEVVVDDFPWILTEVGPMPRVENGRPEVANSAQRFQVRH